MTRNQGWLIAATVAIVVAFAVAARVLPDPVVSHVYPPCPFRALTGCYCPGCGSGRALYQLARGHPADAFLLNPLMVLAIPFVAATLIARWTGVRLRRPISPRWMWVLLGVVIVYGVLRNVPRYPFTLLTPRTTQTQGE